MFRKALTIGIVLILGGRSEAGCRNCYQQTVIQKEVAIKYVEPQVLYFVNPPQVQPSYNYQEVRQASYNQIQRDVQRLTSQLAEMQSQEQVQPQVYYPAPQQYIQPQQYYQPQPQQQYYAPQQQVQQPCPTCGQAQATPGPACQGSEMVTPPTPEPVNPQEQPQIPPQPAPPDPTKFNLQSDSPVPMLESKCVKCHGKGGKAEQKFSIEGPMNWDKAKAIAEQVNSGEMPRDSGNHGAPLSDPEKDELFKELVNTLKVQ